MQSGLWIGANHFTFSDTEDDTCKAFGTCAFPDDWDYLEPKEWYGADALELHAMRQSKLRSTALNDLVDQIVEPFLLLDYQLSCLN